MGYVLASFASAAFIIRLWRGTYRIAATLALVAATTAPASAVLLLLEEETHNNHTIRSSAHTTRAEAKAWCDAQLAAWAGWGGLRECHEEGRVFYTAYILKLNPYDNPPVNPGLALSSLHCENDEFHVPTRRCVPTVDILRRPVSTQQCMRAGNPIVSVHGVKQQSIDLGVSLGGFAVALHYDSTPLLPIVPTETGYTNALPVEAQRSPALGRLWTTTLHRNLVLSSNWSDFTTRYANRADGNPVSLIDHGSGYRPDANAPVRLTRLGDFGGYLLHDLAGGMVEHYQGGTAGRADHLQWLNGVAVALIYSTPSTPRDVAPDEYYLISAVDSFGRRLEFTYELPVGGNSEHDGRLKTMSSSAGDTWRFDYDPAGNLMKVTWPDQTSSRLVYEDSTLPHALTGMIDERGARLSTFGYDAMGRAVHTSHAGLANAYSVRYQEPPVRSVTRVYDAIRNKIVRYHEWTLPTGTVLTGPNGSATDQDFVLAGGQSRMAAQSQEAGAGCAASTRRAVFDDNGNTVSSDDFAGNRTCMAYDTSRNLRTVVVEGLAADAAERSCTAVLAGNSPLPPGSRKTSMRWHPDWHLRVGVAAPGRLVIDVYNGQPDPFANNVVASCAPAQGKLEWDSRPIPVLCKRIEFATTDENGEAGFEAAVDSRVPQRQWAWTYTAKGQVLTHTDPAGRTSASEYYTSSGADWTIGDLRSARNPLGHTTRFTRYNKRGQNIEAVDANGAVATHTYDERARLRSVSVSGQTTTYAYWPNGLLQTLTAPDGSAFVYDYDAAQRLTAVSDQLGNRVEYTLDAAGNRVAEVVKDPSGRLRRAVERSIDALGRVQQLTGRE